jgi:hypothetical protein
MICELALSTVMLIRVPADPFVESLTERTVAAPAAVSMIIRA